jgi:predicted nucleic acid-binding protein
MILFMASNIIAYKVSQKLRISMKSRILVAIAIAAAVFVVAASLCEKFLPEYYYSLIRVSTSHTEDANTALKAVVDGESVIAITLNWAVAIIRILLPFELAAKGNVIYFPYIIFQLFVTVIFVNGVLSADVNTPSKNIGLVVFGGFILCSAAFEPDFGSWLRHETVTFPLFMHIADLQKGREKRACSNCSNFQTETG